MGIENTTWWYSYIIYTLRDDIRMLFTHYVMIFVCYLHTTWWYSYVIYTLRDDIPTLFNTTWWYSYVIYTLRDDIPTLFTHYVMIFLRYLHTIWWYSYVIYTLHDDIRMLFTHYMMIFVCYLHCHVCQFRTSKARYLLWSNVQFKNRQIDIKTDYGENMPWGINRTQRTENFELEILTADLLKIQLFWIVKFSLRKWRAFEFYCLIYLWDVCVSNCPLHLF